MDMTLTVGNGKWKLMKRCGKGAFGQVFFGINQNTK